MLRHNVKQNNLEINALLFSFTGRKYDNNSSIKYVSVGQSFLMH